VRKEAARGNQKESEGDIGGKTGECEKPSHQGVRKSWKGESNWRSIREVVHVN